VEVLAIVPARGGSKGLPRKNVLPLLGRPLIEWSIRAALEATTVDRVIVSTDDDEIASIARAAGAEVPFQRPADLAADDTADLPVFQHALRWLFDHEGYRPDLVVQLRPTSPVRPAGLVDRGVELLAGDPLATSLRCVCVAPITPYKMWTIEDGLLRPLLGTIEEERFNSPRQRLPVVHWQIGEHDEITAEVNESGSKSRERNLAWELAGDIAIDIDDQLAFERAARALDALDHE
jgi:N-acylneuraminate cytidylyltransferase